MANSYSMHHSWRCSAVLAEYVLGICWAADPWHLFLAFKRSSSERSAAGVAPLVSARGHGLQENTTAALLAPGGLPVMLQLFGNRGACVSLICAVIELFAFRFYLLSHSWLILLVHQQRRLNENVEMLVDFLVLFVIFLRKISTVCWGHDREALGWGPMGPFSFPCK